MVAWERLEAASQTSNYQFAGVRQQRAKSVAALKLQAKASWHVQQKQGNGTETVYTSSISWWRSMQRNLDCISLDEIYCYCLTL